ncbi:MAG: hypothetical protein P4L96_03085 [Rhodoferax sp.]|nr:hypothetical protein [Rhodoferax sp.]
MTQINADGTSAATITVSALDANNALVPNAALNLSTTTGGILSSAAVTTGATGTATAGTATVQLTADAANQANRVAVVTATCVGSSASPVPTQITIVGASIAVSAQSNTVLAGGTTTLSATVKNVSGSVMSGVPVSFGATDPTILSVPATATTNTSGVAAVNVMGVNVGTASINVSALGNVTQQAFTTSLGTTALTFKSPANNAILPISSPQTLTVAAPGASSVTFATTLGTFANGQATFGTGGGTATASLTSTQGGVATVSVTDNLNRTAVLQLTFSPPVSAANKILLNANVTTVQVASNGATGTAGGTAIITARAVYNNNGQDQPVANVPISFSMVGGPGGGESLTPALKLTGSDGTAVATFSAGTLPSISNGIAITATIPNTAISTGVAPSSNNVLLTIGGQALSVAFGGSTVLGSNSDNTLYTEAYSVLVTDANNNPVPNAVVTLRLKPYAFSTGGACSVAKTFCSEDVNGNGSLDPGEDGYRQPYTLGGLACPSAIPSGATYGTMDGKLTPANSDAGAVPSTVTTDATGTAPFTLTYLKGSALWVVAQLTATVSSAGTESSASTIFRLAPSVPDVGPPCLLPSSPYVE